MAEYQFSLHTKLSSFKGGDIRLSIKKNIPSDKRKKQARILLSEKFTTDRVGFLHAVLISLEGEYLLLAGPSGVGKTTFAKALVKGYDAQIMANDWVAVEREGSEFFVSDFNYEKSILHKARCRLKGVLFVTKTDKYRRDAYVPNNKEFEELISKLFDGVSAGSAQTLATFWIANQQYLPFYCALPIRGKDTNYVMRTFAIILQRIKPVDMLVQVGVVGVGAVGSALASELGKQQLVQRVHLFNRSEQAVTGLALDLNQALYREDDVYVAHDNVEDLFRRSSIIFLVLREKNDECLEKNVPERWKRIRPHIESIKKYAKVAADVGFSGTVFIVTNPVDFLTYAYYWSSQRFAGTPQRTFQVYGIGLEGDAARAVFYSHRFLPRLALPDVSVYGSHADELFIDVPLPAEQLEELTVLVKGASQEVRAQSVRTIYGPVAAAIRSFRAYIDGGTTHLSMVRGKSYVGRKVSFKFGLPMTEPVADDHRKKYAEVVKINQVRIAKYKRLL